MCAPVFFLVDILLLADPLQLQYLVSLPEVQPASDDSVPDIQPTSDGLVFMGQDHSDAPGRCSLELNMFHMSR